MKNYFKYRSITVVFFIIFMLIQQSGIAREYMLRKIKWDSIPSPIVPQYEKLKNLYLVTKLVDESKPAITIVAPAEYASEGRKIKDVIKELTGVTVPLLENYPEQRIIPLDGNLILLGNRSTNPAIGVLYDRAYTFLDLKYPGSGGYVVRSLHSPFGNGRNVLFAGGSDLEGVRAATASLIESLEAMEGKPGTLSVNYLAKIKLGKDYALPDNIKDVPIWEASEKYGSTGYFGWNMISKNMALYYMTGEERYLREFLRLSFPDKAIIDEINVTDGELIEDKTDPLAGPYHYAAHMMIEMWDLIEESPLLNDEQRLKITNAFARQLKHRLTEYGSMYRITKPPEHVFDRHYDWAAFSLYALGRYFEKDYSDTVWKHCIDAADLYFSALKSTYWTAGNNDHLFWFTSYYDPLLNYLLFTGKRDPEMMANLRKGLNTQQILSTGQKTDWGLNASSLSMLNKAAYILNENRWIYFRERINLDTNEFRLGQSFWPGPDLQSAPPIDLVGNWDIQWMPKEMWKARLTGFPQKQSFRWGSYRSELGAGGDYILLKGYNGAGRNPYHTFDVLELRLNGTTLLKGYHNQLLTSADGMLEPKVAMDAALLYQGVVGEVAAAVARVPDLAFVNWRRSLVLRKGRYALIADELEFRGNSRNILAETTWEMPDAKWMPQNNLVRIQSKEAPRAVYELHPSDLMEVKSGKVTTMNWRGAGNKGKKHISFYLLGENPSGKDHTLASLQLADNATALALPEAAIATVGQYQGIEGDLVILSEKALYGHAIRTAGLVQPLLIASSPVEIDWDFITKKLVVVNRQPVTLSLALAAPGAMLINNKRVSGKAFGELYTFELPAGKQEFTGVSPSAVVFKMLANQLPAMLQEARQLRKRQLTQHAALNKTILPVLTPIIQAKLSGKPVNSIIIPSDQGDQLGIAVGNTVTILSAKGQEIRKLSTSGKIRVLRWWAEPKLLLVGCADEKVIAFDEHGNKKWEFTSLMDSAVFEAGKQYWFKSAYPGIYGLYSGYFDNGKSRAFIGSAGTIEILNDQGQLVKRMPVFWGNPRQFLIVNAPDGSKNLLAARWQSDNPNLAIVNNKTMEVDRFGYMGVPEGYTQVNGWMVMNRLDNFYVDMDGDGRQEIVSAINGAWNRVSIYSGDGKPLYNAQFGPGAVEPRANIRMMDVGDITGDGKPEILLGLSSGLVDVLDGQARKIWAKSLPSAPVVVKLVKGAVTSWLCVGSEDGTVSAMDANGNIIKQGKVNGRPADLQVIQTPKGQAAVITTDTGEVSGFRIDALKVSSSKE
jgi:hypothetical protein